MTTETVHCAKCGAIIDEPASTKPENRKPCPACGSTARVFKKKLEGKATFRASMRARLKSARTKKTEVEVFSGDDLQRNTGKWMDKHRRIDYPQDQYEETVTDPETGKVIHCCKEPLSKHTGHGSAKQKAKQQPKS